MIETSLQKKDYTSRRGELSTYGRSVNSSATVKWLWIGIVALVIGLLLVVLLLPDTSLISFSIAVTVLICGAAYLWNYTNEHFIKPELATRKWLQQLCDGELDATIGLPDTHPHYKELDFHTRNVASTLQQLSTDMENLVDTQTRRLENQNLILELLFQLTSDVAREIDQQSVLDTVCTDLANWQDDAPVAAYIPEGDQLKLQAASKPDIFANTLERSELVDSITSGDISGQGYQLKIPFFKGSEVAGMVEIRCHDDQLHCGPESQQVFKTVSDQLSMFFAKHSALESAHHAQMISERTRLGAEIHDSLAQTLLASRYQIRMLRESFEKDRSDLSLNDLLKVEGIIDEANVEVRELISEYRKTPDQHRYADSIQSIVDDFNQGGDGTPVFFQNDNPHIQVSAREGSVIQRIISEALVNANKYADATMIRVYLRAEQSGVRNVLIEDDGIGFCSSDLAQTADSMGEHIGLSIMRDRAMSIGAIMTIDSEPGEGTRISLKLPPFVLLREAS